MKTILVCCGSGVATSPQVANKINDFLEEQGLDGLAHAEPHPVETAKSRIDSNPDIIAYVGIAPADDDLSRNNRSKSCDRSSWSSVVDRYG